MKSLLTRFASIGTILSLIWAGSSAQTLGLPGSPSLHIHKGAISFFLTSNEVLAKVTASCTGGPGMVVVTITQTAAQSNAGMAAGPGFGSSTVKCDGQPRAIAVSVGLTDYYNIGQATAMATLTGGNGMQVSATRTIELRFPVLEGMEEEQGGND